MTASDIKMIIAMLAIIKNNASEHGDEKTVHDIQLVLDVLTDKLKE